MKATLRLTVQKRTISTPRFAAPPQAVDAGPYKATMGIAPDLLEGARTAVRAMVEWVVEDHGLTREDAYVLCSLAGDLKILGIVDAGVWNVGMVLPVSVLE